MSLTDFISIRSTSDLQIGCNWSRQARTSYFTLLSISANTCAADIDRFNANFKCTRFCSGAQKLYFANPLKEMFSCWYHRSLGRREYERCMPQFVKLSPPPLSSKEVNSLVTRPGRDFVRMKIKTTAFVYSEENESGQVWLNILCCQEWIKGSLIQLLLQLCHNT